MSDKSKKPLQVPPQLVPSGSETTSGATAFDSNQWLVEQMRMEEEAHRAQLKGAPGLFSPGSSDSPGLSSGSPGLDQNQWLMNELQQEEAQQSGRPPLAAGMWQELSYPIPKDFPGSAKGATDRHNLSFRDKSGYESRGNGFKRSTSEAFLNKAHSGNKWKGLRLDYGRNVKTGNQTNWHWNQKGAMNAFGHTDHALASPAAVKTGQVLKGLKPLSRGAMVLGAGMDAYDLGREAHQSMQTGEWGNTAYKGAEIAGGWAGAYAGAKSLGAAGAGIGTAVGGPVGTVVGGAIGGIAGGIGGYLAGTELAKWLGSWW